MRERSDPEHERRRQADGQPCRPAPPLLSQGKAWLPIQTEGESRERKGRAEAPAPCTRVETSASRGRHFREFDRRSLRKLLFELRDLNLDGLLESLSEIAVLDDDAPRGCCITAPEVSEPERLPTYDA